MNWGGFLMVALPEYPVSIDGRNDLYGDGLLEREVKTMVAEDWQGDAAIERANLVPLPNKLPHYHTTDSSGNWISSS